MQVGPLRHRLQERAQLRRPGPDRVQSGRCASQQRALTPSPALQTEPSRAARTRSGPTAASSHVMRSRDSRVDARDLIAEMQPSSSASWPCRAAVLINPGPSGTSMFGRAVKPCWQICCCQTQEAEPRPHGPVADAVQGCAACRGYFPHRIAVGHGAHRIAVCHDANTGGSPTCIARRQSPATPAFSPPAGASVVADVVTAPDDEHQRRHAALTSPTPSVLTKLAGPRGVTPASTSALPVA